MQPKAIKVHGRLSPVSTVGGWGSLSPRLSLIGVKQATVKSHQKVGKLSETGNLL